MDDFTKNMVTQFLAERDFQNELANAVSQSRKFMIPTQDAARLLDIIDELLKDD